MDSGLSGLIGAVIGASSAIGVGLLNNSHERKLQRQHIYRERLEELYILVGQWSRLRLEHFGRVISFMRGETTQDEYYNHKIKLPVNFDFSRLEMIVNMYGVVLKPSFNSLREILEQMRFIEKGIEEFNAVVKKEALIEPYAQQQHQFNSAIELFKTEIVKVAKKT